MTTNHHHTPEEERRIREAALDETIADTFPASDPLSTLPNPDEHDAPGSGVNEQGKADVEVRDNRAESRFEIVTAQGIARLEYIRQHDAMVFVHTEVPVVLRGRGLSNALAAAGLAAARREGLRIVAVCPVVRKYLREHPV